MSHKKYREENNCLNCNAVVSGHFCAQCGQENIELKENFVHLSTEFVSDYFHFDSKFFRSVAPLFARPGFLTKEYWEGRRIRYIHPLRLYFFITILFMLAATYFYNHVDKLRIEDAFATETITLSHADSVLAAKDHESAKIVERRFTEAKAKLNLSSAIEHFFHDLKYISFFLLPVYAMIFRLLYIRRKGYYVDHLVYTLHLQSFIYLWVGVAFFIATFAPEHIGIIRRTTIFITFVYVAMSLRYLYHQSWWKTILKSFLSTIMLISAMVFVLGIYFVIFSSIVRAGE